VLEELRLVVLTAEGRAPLQVCLLAAADLVPGRRLEAAIADLVVPTGRYGPVVGIWEDCAWHGGVQARSVQHSFASAPMTLHT
jgi:hypothetical protein